MEATPMRLDSKSVRDGKMDGGQAWKVIPGIPFMIIKRKMPHSMMFRLKLITRLNLMIDGYVTYHINSDFTFAWQTTLYSKQNDYRYANHKKWATENAFVLQYHMTPDITPYIEYDYLDRQGVYNGRDNLSENSYRIGVSFKL